LLSSSVVVMTMIAGVPLPDQKLRIALKSAFDKGCSLVTMTPADSSPHQQLVIFQILAPNCCFHKHHQGQQRFPRAAAGAVQEVFSEWDH
jgi:hypothetical protein